MQRRVESDLADLVVIMEALAKDVAKMPDPDKVDLAARLKPVAKACKVIDDVVKAMVRAKRKGKEGTVLGNDFKAVLKLVDTKRFDQASFKEDEPRLFDEYCKDATDERVTFELR